MQVHTFNITPLCMLLLLAALHFRREQKKKPSCNYDITSLFLSLQISASPPGQGGNLGLRGSALHLNRVLGRTGSNIVGLLQLPQDVTTVTNSFTRAFTQDDLRVREKCTRYEYPSSIFTPSKLKLPIFILLVNYMRPHAPK